MCDMDGVNITSVLQPTIICRDVSINVAAYGINIILIVVIIIHQKYMTLLYNYHGQRSFVRYLGDTNSHCPPKM